MIKRTLQTAAILTAGLFCFSPSVEAASPESDDSIKIALNDWSSQNVSSYILGNILSEVGYNVEYIQADAMAQFAGLETGDPPLIAETFIRRHLLSHFGSDRLGIMQTRCSLDLSDQQQRHYRLERVRCYLTE
jgi:ABC-type proline/glycine betaine transport system substrate-binding protein